MVVSSPSPSENDTSVHFPPPPPASALAQPHPLPTVETAASNLLRTDEGTLVSGDGTRGGFPSATLTCRPNSHVFKERTLFGLQHQQAKIGRSVAKSRPSDNNAIFDCKVLSRNHALLWYRDGKFYLQDTKSSNGTFVNNSRLSKGSEESEPREVRSGDILQFGVDVQENTKKLTHGCIVATVRLFLPDGREAKAGPAVASGYAAAVATATALPPQDLYQLNQYIQEALVREQMLETKLAMLQRLVGQTNKASDEAWKSLIDEDRLLTRVESLGSQLSVAAAVAGGKGSSTTEDALREETKRLLEDKEVYQETAKMSLKKLVEEKLEAVKKQQELGRSLSNTEDEFALLKEAHERDVFENYDLASQVSRLSAELEKEISRRSEKAVVGEDVAHQDGGGGGKQQLLLPSANVTMNEIVSLSVQDDGSTSSKRNLLSGATVTVSVENVATCLMEAEAEAAAADDNDTRSTVTSGDADESKAEVDQLKDRMGSLQDELESVRSNYTQVMACNENGNVELAEAKEELADALLRLQEKEVAADDELEALRSQLVAVSNERAMLENVNDELKSELTDCRAQLVAVQTERRDDDGDADADADASGYACDGEDRLEKSLCDAEAKISELIKVKERFAEVEAERTNLALNLSEMEDAMDVLSFQAQTATACSLVPLVILVLAVMVAYLPCLSALFGTAENL